jgi:hypothetical protein
MAAIVTKLRRLFRNTFRHAIAKRSIAVPESVRSDANGRRKQIFDEPIPGQAGASRRDRGRLDSVDREITDPAGHPAIICMKDGQGGPEDPRSTRNSSKEANPRVPGADREHQKACRYVEKVLHLRRICRTAASVDCFFWFDISTRSLGSQTPECVSWLRRVWSPDPADGLQHDRLGTGEGACGRLRTRST